MKFLVTAGLDRKGIAALEEWGEVHYEYYGEKMQILGGRKLIQALQEVEIFITEADQVRKPVFAACPGLKAVGCCRGNPVNIDLAAATERQIPVLYTPGRNAAAVAELTVAFLIMLARRVPQTSSLLRERRGGGFNFDFARAFLEFKGMELGRKTVGLVGFGAVGKSVARRLSGFGCRILAYDPYAVPAPGEALEAELVSLEELLGQSDFVSVHAAVTPETTGLIGAREFALMKPGAFFLNLARAAVADEAALVEALAGKHLAGAALDVFAKEPPPPDHPLLNMDNVIATPHIGGNTCEVIEHQSEIIVGDMIRLLRGEQPRHCANPGVLDGFSLA